MAVTTTTPSAYFQSLLKFVPTENGKTMGLLLQMDEVSDGVVSSVSRILDIHLELISLEVYMRSHRPQAAQPAVKEGFLPLYLNELHWKRAKGSLPSCIEALTFRDSSTDTDSSVASSLGNKSQPRSVVIPLCSVFTFVVNKLANSLLLQKQQSSLANKTQTVTMTITDSTINDCQKAYLRHLALLTQLIWVILHENPKENSLAQRVLSTTLGQLPRPWRVLSAREDLNELGVIFPLLLCSHSSNSNSSSSNSNELFFSSQTWHTHSWIRMSFLWQFLQRTLFWVAWAQATFSTTEGSVVVSSDFPVSEISLQPIVTSSITSLSIFLNFLTISLSPSTTSVDPEFIFQQWEQPGPLDQPPSGGEAVEVTTVQGLVPKLSSLLQLPFEEVNDFWGKITSSQRLKAFIRQEFQWMSMAQWDQLRQRWSNSSIQDTKLAPSVKPTLSSNLSFALGPHSMIETWDWLPSTPVPTPSQTPEGLQYVPAFLTEQQEADLLLTIDQEGWGSSNQAKMARRIHHYGYPYKYPADGIDTQNRLGDLPLWCQPFLHRIVFTEGWLPVMPDQLTVNEYLPGQGIAPHVDSTDTIADFILILSLGVGSGSGSGGGCVMNFTSLASGRKFPIWLESRSLTIMAGKSRYEYTHHISKRKVDFVNSGGGSGVVVKALERSRRVSLTFRKILL